MESEQWWDIPRNLEASGITPQRLVNAKAVFDEIAPNLTQDPDLDSQQGTYHLFGAAGVTALNGQIDLMLSMFPHKKAPKVSAGSVEFTSALLEDSAAVFDYLQENGMQKPYEKSIPLKNVIAPQTLDEIDSHITEKLLHWTTHERIEAIEKYVNRHTFNLPLKTGYSSPEHLVLPASVWHRGRTAKKGNYQSIVVESGRHLVLLGSVVDRLNIFPGGSATVLGNVGRVICAEGAKGEVVGTVREASAYGNGLKIIGALTDRFDIDPGSMISLYGHLQGGASRRKPIRG